MLRNMECTFILCCFRIKTLLIYQKYPLQAAFVADSFRSFAVKFCSRLLLCHQSNGDR